MRKATRPSPRAIQKEALCLCTRSEPPSTLLAHLQGCHIIQDFPSYGCTHNFIAGGGGGERREMGYMEKLQTVVISSYLYGTKLETISHPSLPTFPPLTLHQRERPSQGPGAEADRSMVAAPSCVEGQRSAHTEGLLYIQS